MTRLRVVQVFFHADGEPRDPNTVLDEWPTIPTIAAALKQAGVDITTVLASHRDEIVVRDGVEFHFVNDRRGTPGRRIGLVRFRRRPTRIIDRVRFLEPDVIHAHDLQYPIAVGQLARALESVPVLIQDHAVVPPSDWRRVPWRWALKPVAGAAFTAREQAAPFFEARVFQRDLPLFEILPTSSTFRPGDREAARRATGIFGDPCFLWTTHLDANKDPMTALDAFERAAPHLADPRLWLCFLRAPMLDAVERRIAGSTILRERVTLLGARSAKQV